ncbi:MAG: helix-hairpin-helix domain-containing protein [Bacteroidetes bacterium]|nr:helix-hairpin-helix domain-containing protein [Bacteroidota bacterium]
MDAIGKYIEIDPSKIKKININTCEVADLKNGYIKWNVANAIVNYRKSHGKYKSVDEIKKTDLVDDETYRKIVPYLILD